MFILGAYGYVHKGRAKGTNQHDKVIPVAAKVMKGKQITQYVTVNACVIFCVVRSLVKIYGRSIALVSTVLNILLTT